jgi:uncharacterized repeat protein (TIGR01451 family)
MKKQINPTIKAHLIRSAFILLSLLAVCAIPFALAQRNSSKQSKQFQKAFGSSHPLTTPEGEIPKEKFMVRMAPQALLGPVSFSGYENPAPVPKSLLPSVNIQINNNNGFSCTQGFTHSETTALSFGSTIIAGFNDSGSLSFGNHFTGWSRSTDGGATWTDGGTLPASSGGDAGDPVLARDTTSGQIYFATLGFTDGDVIQVFRSTDNGATWLAPVNGAPGGSSEDKEWITVDNFPGSGQGNVYLVARNFGAGDGIYFTRSTDAGNTWGPNGGTLIASGSSVPVQGAFVTVSPDHSVHAYWYDNGGSINVRKSTDQGLTFDSAVTIVSGLSTAINGDLGLTGTLNGGGSVSIRSNTFPHVAVNPVSGNIYVAYNQHGAGADKSDIFFVQSTDGGANWSSATQVNDDGTTTDQWFPNVVVSPCGDAIGIFYYSRQEDTANNNLFKYYGRVGSISGGTVTFAPSSAVSDTASFPELNRDSVVNTGYMGDYDIAYARPGFFDVTWSDNRNDLPGCPPKKEPDVFYQSIAVGLADLSITKTDFPDPVTTGDDLTYTITVTNNGPDTATSVTLTDNLPPETTFVSCSSTGGGVCGGSGNNRTVTFASLASGESETITFVANVNCSVADGTVISNTATVSSCAPDPDATNNSATATTTASNPPPTIANATADPSILWPPNHRMVNVTVSYDVTDNCPLPPGSCTLDVTSNEPVLGHGSGHTSPDWIVLDDHHVLLRAEREGPGNGRIYTITITCVDSGGNTSTDDVTVTVPHDRGRR